MKKIALLAALVFGLASAVSADIPWPLCYPCPAQDSGK